jgi:antitoxin CptB
MESGENGDAELRRLRWRCRRGMRELDQLFERYLDLRWAEASEDERGVFRRLLDCEDDRLWRWFLGHETAADVDLQALVERIRALPV